MRDFNDDFLYRYLKKAKVPYIKKDVESSLMNHPGGPSLKAVSDTLEGLSVRTMAVGLDKYDLDEVDFPVIAHFKRGHGEFVLVESKEDDQVRYYKEGKLLEENLEVFEKNWSGNTLLLDASEKAELKEPKGYYWKKYGKRVLSGLLGLMVLLLAVISVGSQPLDWAIYAGVLLALNVSGFALSLYLFKIHVSKAVGEDKYCKKSKTVDCTAVLFSKWSNVFGLFNWAQLGVIYFFGLSLSLFIGMVSGGLLLPVAAVTSVISLLAGCFSIYSVVLQAFVIKKWCLLCLAGQGLVLTTIGLDLYQGLPFQAEFNLVSFLILGVSYLISIMFSVDYAERHEAQTQLEEKSVQLAGFKGDKEIFEHLLNKQRQAPDYSQLKGVINIGHEAALSEVLMVASLYCGPCMKMFGALRALVEQHPDKFKVKILFTMPRTNDLTEIPVNARLVELAITESDAKVVEAVDSWYALLGRKDGESIWLDRYVSRQPLGNDELFNYVRAHQTWNALGGIYKTPTLFFNGSELPEIYAKADSLKHLIG